MPVLMRVNEPTCTVVICTRDRPAELERCLRAVRQIEYPSFDVLVIDNAPIKTPAREAAERWAARYVVEPVRGVSRARNRGAFHSSSDLIVYLDDDEVPEPRWLSALAHEFQEPRIVAAAGQNIASSRAAGIYSISGQRSRATGAGSVGTRMV